MNFFDLQPDSGRLVVLMALIGVLGLCLSATGCSAEAKGSSDQTPADRPLSHVERHGPDEYGVVCYRHQGASSGSSLSCVKVKEQ